MTELHDLHDLPQYVGGDVAPADLWGTATERGKACAIVEGVIDLHMVGHVSPPPAYLIVDALIEAGILPDETGPGKFRTENQSRGELIRRVRALHAEARQLEQVLAGALDFPRGDGRFVPREEFDLGEGHTPVTLAEMAAKEIARLRRGTG